jgi:hypothetical protein
VKIEGEERAQKRIGKSKERRMEREEERERGT